MKDKIKYILKNNISAFKFMKYFSRNASNLNAVAADLIRYTHSMEKGLCIDNVRLGFGHEKQKHMIQMIKKLENSNSSYYSEIIKMAVSSLCAYVEYHDKKNYSDDYIVVIKDFISKYSVEDKKKFGGIEKLDVSKLNFNIDEIERFMQSRHSIRHFSDKPVAEETIRKAISLAQRAPSACNRQGVRVYVVDKSKAGIIMDGLKGIGGFSESIDKIIVITGKLSSYSYNEINQYIVSASIFVGYLSLTLHLYGLGACIIQRPVIWNKSVDEIKKNYNIHADEQIVCMVGVGNVDGEIVVPISHRIDIDEFYKYIK